MKNLPGNTYWYPDYPRFLFDDAVSPCQVYNSENNVEPFLAYIQVTIQDHKTFNEDRLKNLDDVIEKNASLSGLKRVFVIVTRLPETSLKDFKLSRPPDPETVPTIIGYFDPTQLTNEKQ